MKEKAISEDVDQAFVDEIIASVETFGFEPARAAASLFAITIKYIEKAGADPIFILEKQIEMIKEKKL